MYQAWNPLLINIILRLSVKILAFDTTSQTLSTALLEGDQILSQNTIHESGKQSELLIPEIENLLTQNNIWYQDLDLIAVTHGPGSFTGSRIGLSVARILKLATNLPLMLLNSCEAIAHKHRHKTEKTFILLDARADEFFYAEFSPKTQITSEPKLSNLEDLLHIFPKEDFFLCGSGKNIAAEILQKQGRKCNMDNETDIVEAALLGSLAYQKYEKYHYQETQNLNPLYLRAPRISKRKK